MNNPAASFTRIVLGLEQGTSDSDNLRFAAEFAKLLRLDLFGLFAEDPSLAHLANLPTLREFKLLERRWRPVEGRNLSGEFESSARVARKAFEEIAQASGVPQSFEIVRARAMDAIATITGETDIVLVCEPRQPANLAMPAFSETVDAAMATPAAVLVVPNSLIRQHGPVLAIGETTDDPNLTSAAKIAAAAHERLEVLTTKDSTMSISWRRPDQPGERMIIMTRRISASLNPLAIASRRRVPVLVLAPSHVSPSERRVIG